MSLKVPDKQLPPGPQAAPSVIEKEPWNDCVRIPPLTTAGARDVAFRVIVATIIGGATPSRKLILMGTEAIERLELVAVFAVEENPDGAPVGWAKVMIVAAVAADANSSGLASVVSTAIATNVNASFVVMCPFRRVAPI